MSSICVDVDDPGQRKECGTLILDCTYPGDGKGVSSRLRTENSAPEWADASEEVETSTKFEAASVPVGMGAYDSGALSQYQQKRLNQLKMATVQDNYQYLADHPELKAMLMLFLDHLLKTKPKNVRASAGEFFRSERTLSRALRKYLGMQFWKPPQRSSSASSTTDGGVMSSTDEEKQQLVEEEAEEEGKEDSSSSAAETVVTEESVLMDTMSLSQEEVPQRDSDQRNQTGDTQMMLDMALSYDSKMILNLSSKKQEEKRSSISTVAFRKQVSFGGTLLPRTPGWEIDPTVHFFVEDIQPDIAKLYGTEQVDIFQRKLKFNTG